MRYNQDMYTYVGNQIKTNLEVAKQEFKDYWFAWETLVGDKHEGVLMEIDNGTYHVLCTDGVERAV
jgi:hypothetical protein